MKGLNVRTKSKANCSVHHVACCALERPSWILIGVILQLLPCIVFLSSCTSFVCFVCHVFKTWQKTDLYVVKADNRNQSLDHPSCFSLISFYPDTSTLQWSTSTRSKITLLRCAGRLWTIYTLSMAFLSLNTHMIIWNSIMLITAKVGHSACRFCSASSVCLWE